VRRADLTTESVDAEPAVARDNARPADDSEPEGGYAISLTPRCAVKNSWHTHRHTHDNMTRLDAVERRMQTKEERLTLLGDANTTPQL
jgi:hypothetical protein